MKCAHCKSNLHPIMFGAEVYQILWRGKELELLQRLIHAGGFNIAYARLEGALECNKNSLGVMVNAINRKLISTEYWIACESGFGLRLERRGC